LRLKKQMKTSDRLAISKNILVRNDKGTVLFCEACERCFIVKKGDDLRKACSAECQAELRGTKSAQSKVIARALAKLGREPLSVKVSGVFLRALMAGLEPKSNSATFEIKGSPHLEINVQIENGSARCFGYNTKTGVFRELNDCGDLKEAKEAMLTEA